MRDAPPSSDRTVTLSVAGAEQEREAKPSCWHLVLLWSEDEPDRVGECCAVPRSALLGRGTATEPGDPPKLEFSRQRPGFNEPTGVLSARALSRRQLKLVPAGDALSVENLGRRTLLHNGQAATACQAKVGDTIAIDGVALFAVVERPRVLAAVGQVAATFGETDADGIVGETPEVYSLRGEIRRLASTPGHVLVLGESGSGKELCVQALHRQSALARGPLVSRNAATIPASLVEAELFGQASGYPNAGAPARQGLFGLAHGGTLFLDEIAELGEAQQASLLRVLDAGEYQRLGEDKLRRSDLRVVGATNRPLQALKPDVLARFPERLIVPSLDARRADIPLLVRHLLRRLGPGMALPSCQLALIDALVRHRYTLNFRELERLVRLAVKGGEHDRLRLNDELLAELDLPRLDEPGAEQVREALAASSSLNDAARRLGLPNRWALTRLMKRLGINQA